ncbi:hypothetical protein [Asticcacaulis sp. AND118]|nr:hypothetical protein [Asticcacaulis sp. AND118]
MEKEKPSVDPSREPKTPEHRPDTEKEREEPLFEPPPIYPGAN